ncbi:hypothetical protein L9F63_023929, partial [Diploptera punctata]
CCTTYIIIDMGHFLSETLAEESLSESAELQRVALLQRLETFIATDVTSAPNTPPPYLDMNGPKEYVDAEVNGVKIEEAYEEFPAPSPPPVPRKQPLDLSTSPSTCPDYENLSLPFSELRNMTSKCGPLWRKEKFIFLDQWRRCWAGIYGHVVLLYNSERDVKPTSSLDVQGFDARPITSNIHKDPKKNDATFEVVCPGRKTHQFIARTAKDMTQWVLAISQAGSEESSSPRSHRSQHSPAYRKLPSLPDSEEYDDVVATDSLQNYERVQTEDEIYHDISDMYQNGSVIRPKCESSEQPPLPPRTPVPSVILDNSCGDAVYDDIGVNYSPSDYSNLPDCDETDRPTVSETGKKDITNAEEDWEVIYDDIGVIEQLPEDSKQLGFRRESLGGFRIL